MQNDDNSAGCTVQPVAQPGAEKAGQAADSYGDGEQAWKTIGQQTLLFLLAFVFAPKHGLLANRRRARLVNKESV